MFMRNGDARLRKENWNNPIKAASRSADLSPKRNTYLFDHSVITDLVNSSFLFLTGSINIYGSQNELGALRTLELIGIRASAGYAGAIGHALD